MSDSWSGCARRFHCTLIFLLCGMWIRPVFVLTRTELGIVVGSASRRADSNSAYCLNRLKRAEHHVSFHIQWWVMTQQWVTSLLVGSGVAAVRCCVCWPYTVCRVNVVWYIRAYHAIVGCWDEVWQLRGSLACYIDVPRLLVSLSTCNRSSKSAFCSLH